MIRNTIVLILLFGNALYAQEAVNLRVGGGMNYTKYYYEDLEDEHINIPDISIKEGPGVYIDANIEFRLNKYVQFESGLSYQRFVMPVTIFGGSESELGSKSTLEANFKQTNNLFYVPLGGSLVLPYKKSEFLLGLRLFVGFSNLDKEGTWDYYGTNVRLQPDSTTTSENFHYTYTDNDIGGVVNPTLKTQFHFAYQYKLNDKWNIYAKIMAGKGELSKKYGLNYWQYSGQVGVVYKLIDYNEKRKTMEEREQERLPFPH